MLSTMYKCKVCQFEFPFEKVVYSNDGKKLLCRDCKRIFECSKTQKAGENKTKSTGSDENIHLICVDCRYKFKLKKKPNMKLECPYCGKDKLIKDEGTAQKIIDEVSTIPERERY